MTIAPDTRVAFLGDSFTQGTGDDAALGWVGRLVAAERGRGANLTGYNLGVRGQTGAQIAERAQGEVSRRLIGFGERRAVVIAFGTNDIFFGRPAAESVRALEGLLRWSREQDLPAFFIANPPMDAPELERAAAALRRDLNQVCRDHAAPFLDLPAAVADWSVWHAQASAGDGIHPNADGYAAVAAAVAQWAPWRAWLDEAGS